MAGRLKLGAAGGLPLHHLRHGLAATGPTCQSPNAEEEKGPRASSDEKRGLIVGEAKEGIDEVHCNRILPTHPVVSIRERTLAGGELL